MQRFPSQAMSHTAIKLQLCAGHLRLPPCSRNSHLPLLKTNPKPRKAPKEGEAKKHGQRNSARRGHISLTPVPCQQAEA